MFHNGVMWVRLRNNYKWCYVGAVKEQLQMVLPMDLGLITNILGNLTHSNENVVKSYSHL
jgi:hypothetical protein